MRFLQPGWQRTDERGVPTKVGVVVASCFILGFMVSTAFAAQTSSAYVRYFGPTQVSGQYQCSALQSTVDNSSKFAYSTTYAERGQNCAIFNSVPPGYIGSQVQLIKGQSGQGGTLCGSTPWQFNNANNYVISSQKTWSQSSNCPANVGYYSSGHGEYFKSNTSTYVKSSWVNSPSLNF